jgi:hypothetical protein
MAIVPLGVLDKNDGYNYRRGMKPCGRDPGAMRRYFSDGERVAALPEIGQSE